MNVESALIERPKLRYAWLWWALGYVLIAWTINDSLERHPPDLGPMVSDKVMHFTGYFLLTTWFAGVARPARYWLVGLGLVMSLMDDRVAAAGVRAAIAVHGRRSMVLRPLLRLAARAARERADERDGAGQDRAEQRQEDDGVVHQPFPWRMIFSENRFPLFGIMR